MNKTRVSFVLLGAALLIATAASGEPVSNATATSTMVTTATSTFAAPAAPASSFTDPVTGMEFVLVKGGCYPMGDNFGDGNREDELPVHEACVSDFYLGKFHVTNEQFKKFVDDTGYRTSAEDKGEGWSLDTDGPSERGWGWTRGANWKHPIWPGDSIEKKMNHPVLLVSWYDAKMFAQWLSRKTGKNYRLAYEAEYEYAIRNGGRKHKYAWGDGPVSGNVADETAGRMYPKFDIFKGYDDGYVYTSPVGSFKPNELGLCDMTGNALSWVEDWYNPDYYAASPKNDPHGPDLGEQKVARGGSWSTTRSFTRASCRIDGFPEIPHNNVGFRVALSVDIEKR